MCELCHLDDEPRDAPTRPKGLMRAANSLAQWATEDPDAKVLNVLIVVESETADHKWIHARALDGEGNDMPSWDIKKLLSEGAEVLLDGVGEREEIL